METVQDKALTLDVMTAGPELRRIDRISDTARRIGLSEAANLTVDAAHLEREAGRHITYIALLKMAEALHDKSKEGAAPAPSPRPRTRMDERRICLDIEDDRLHAATGE